MEEPWDELMGPPPVGSRTPPRDPPPAVPVRTATSSTPPPATMFRTMSNSGGGPPPPGAFANNNNNAAAMTGGLPPHWSQHETDAESARAATSQAVYMASNAALRRTESMGSRTSSAFADEDMAAATDAPSDDYPIPEDANGKYMEHFESTTRSSSNYRTGNHNDMSDDDDDKSTDSAIGREYDARDHDHIRQEALRMLEVADADSHYSVHRTITGGFTAAPKPMGNQRRTRTALQGLNFIANSRNNTNRRSYLNYPEYATARTSSAPTREDFEYGDIDNVVDVIGLENRSASTAAAADGQSTGSSWSSRYSLDRTMLAMSGGAMKHKLDSMDRDNSNSNNLERFSAANLFRNSPVKAPQIFGSGFAFRQEHVFGKQKVTMPTDNLQPVWNDTDEASSTHRAKSWQDQILQQKLQRRRWLICLCLVLVCVMVPLISVVTLRRNRSVDINSSTTPVVQDHDIVTFHVMTDTPHDATQVQKLKEDLAEVSSSANFAVHLGNIQNAKVTNCTRETYTNISSLLEKNSPLRVFVVPGVEDWNNCPNPDDAWDAWFNSFKFYDGRWDRVATGDEFTVFHQKKQLENWAFLKNGVLFVGIHVVSGAVLDAEEVTARNGWNFRWVMGMSVDHHDAIRAMVIFGSAKPGSASNAEFFDPLREYLTTKFSMPTLYVHSSEGTGKTSQYQPFTDLPHFSATQVNYDVKGNPIRVQVGLGDKPFSFV